MIIQREKKTKNGNIKSNEIITKYRQQTLFIAVDIISPQSRKMQLTRLHENCICGISKHRQKLSFYNIA